MNILSGLYKPDSGEIWIDGTPRTFTDPRHALHPGIGMVHQHFQLVPVCDVVEAVALGAESVRGPAGTFDSKVARKRVMDLSEQYNLNVNPDAKIEDLPVGVRQRVEILKALYRQSDILVLDEPSAVLTPFETEELFGIIRGLAEAGTTVIFITHKLNEVLEVADKITVLRRGKVAGSVDPAAATRELLANLMVGRDVELKVVKGPARPRDVVLSIKDLHVRDDRSHMAVKGVSLDIRAGEIVALAGVQGNGQTELVEAIVGLRQLDSGDILIDGRSIMKASPREVSDMGVAHVPEDRTRDGLIGAMSVAENFILDTYHREPYSKGGRLNRKAIEERAEIAVKDYDVRTPGIETYAGSLSGGNQQKVVVAREFSRPVKLVIASQPTRGLDVGSIEYIHKRMVEQRDAGAAVLIVSTELDEVLAVGDRVAVMQGGQIVGIAEGEDATYEKVGMLMGGVH
jgi:simple sugar transport system ATP-binding protein